MLNLHYSVEDLEILDADPNVIGTAKTLVRDLLHLHREYSKAIHPSRRVLGLSVEKVG